MESRYDESNKNNNIINYMEYSFNFYKTGAGY